MSAPTSRYLSAIPRPRPVPPPVTRMRLPLNNPGRNMICPLREIFAPALPGGSAARTPQSYRIGRWAGCVPGGELRAARANRDLCTDEKRIRTEITVMDIRKSGLGMAFIRDRRMRTDVLFIRAHSTIRAE